MHLIMLLEDSMAPVPENLTVVQNFGEERLYVDPPEDIKQLPNTQVVTGQSILVTGEPEAFQEWLKPFPGFWISDNPMLGNWRVVHVKDAIQEKAASEA